MTTINTSDFVQVLVAAYSEQSAITKATKAANAAKTGISQRLLVAAQGCTNATDFVAHCENAETEYRATRNTKKGKPAPLPTCWIQAKSNVKAALSFGMVLSEYETESEMREALNAKRKESKEAKDQDATGTKSVTIPLEMVALVTAFISASQADVKATNAVAHAAMVKLSAILAGAMPKAPKKKGNNTEVAALTAQAA